MIKHLVLFGATGDLAGRFLLPALAELSNAKTIPEGFRITATSERPLDTEAFKSHAESCLRKFAAHLPSSTHQKLLEGCRYQTCDVTLVDDIQRLVETGAAGAALYYLAIPPQIVPKTITALAAADLHQDSRIVLEKPFGQDLQSARELSGLLTELFGPTAEQKIFNVDHVLGRSSLQSLTHLRSSNPLIEAIWNSDYIEEFNIVWEETLALEGRVDFYDNTGALKDVMQNHLMQVLAVSAMNLPASLIDGEDGKKKQQQQKLELLQAVRTPSEKDASCHSRRARYTAGMLTNDSSVFSETVEGYLDVKGVEESRFTETLAEVLLEIDTPRWRGTRFRLRTGKAMARLRKGIEILFRPAKDDVPANKLWIGLNGPQTVELKLNTIDAERQPATVQLSGPQPTSQISPYAHVLRDCLEHGKELSVSIEETTRAWEILTPFLAAWARGDVPLETYPAGSTMPYLNPTGSQL